MTDAPVSAPSPAILTEREWRAIALLLPHSPFLFENYSAVR
ncbi:MAG: hypothetical protein VKL39_20830 [Leptolyngbyaceae bacterium]|nr:hypothetical protein [Leptolyngbyaceae bacterium]